MSFDGELIKDLFRRTNWMDKLKEEDRESYIKGLASLKEITPLTIAQVAEDIQSHTTEPWKWDSLRDIEHHLSKATI